MAKQKTSTTPQEQLLSAQLAFNRLQYLFENIRVQLHQAEDNSATEDFEAYTTAIEAISEMGARECQKAAQNMREARNG